LTQKKCEKGMLNLQSVWGKNLRAMLTFLR